MLLVLAVLLIAAGIISAIILDRRLTSSPEPQTSSEQTGTAADRPPAQPRKLNIADAQDFDPQGDDKTENPDEVSLAYDGNPMGLPKDNHGSVAHTYSASPVGNDGHGQPGSGDQASWLSLAKFNKYSYSKVARFMQKLDQLGVLDSTIIYVTSDMGNPALHSTRNVPTVLAGGLNGKFKMGRRLKMQADCPSSNAWCGENDTTFTPVTNNKILVSIAQAFGVDVNTFGTQPDTKLTTGGLSQLTG